MVLFGEHERRAPEDFMLQSEAISKFDPEEKKLLKKVLNGLILKHEAKRWATTA